MSRIGNALRRLADEGRLLAPPAASPVATARSPEPTSEPSVNLRCEATTPLSCEPICETSSEPIPEVAPHPVGENHSDPQVRNRSNPPAPAMAARSDPGPSPVAPMLVERLENPGAVQEQPGELWPAQLPPEIEIDWLAEDFDGQLDGDDDAYYSPAIRTLAELDADDSGGGDQSVY
jgi:hypothetical protein